MNNLIEVDHEKRSIISSFHTVSMFKGNDSIAVQIESLIYYNLCFQFLAHHLLRRLTHQINDCVAYDIAGED